MPCMRGFSGQGGKGGGAGTMALDLGVGAGPWLDSWLLEKPRTKETPMAKYTSVLHQLLQHVPRDEFRTIVSNTKATRRCGSCRAGGSSWRFFRAVNRTA